MPGFGNPGVDFEARQLTAFSRFGALGHFYLQVGCVGQVGAGYAKSARSDLFDGTATPVTIVVGLITVGIFAAFSAVALAADAIHGNCQGFMGLFTDGTVRHSSGFESSNNGISRFDLIQGDRRPNRIKLK